MGSPKTHLIKLSWSERSVSNAVESQGGAADYCGICTGWPSSSLACEVNTCGDANANGQARAAGLSLAGTPLDLLRRLNYLSNYVKLKTAGKTLGSAVGEAGEDTNAGGSGPHGVSTGGGASLLPGTYGTESGSDDEDLDGKPLDTSRKQRSYSR